MTNIIKLPILFFILISLISCGGGDGSSNNVEEVPLAIEYTDTFGEVKSIPVEKVSNTEYIADISDVDYAEDNQIIVTLGSNITKNTNKTTNAVQGIANQDSTEEQFLFVTYNDESYVLYELRVSGKNNRFAVNITDPLEKGSTKLMFTVSEPEPVVPEPVVPEPVVPKPVVPKPVVPKPVVPKPVVPKPVVPKPNSNQVKTSANAASFLNRATFGPTEKSINNLMSKGSYESWLSVQFNMPPTLHTPKILALAPKMCIPVEYKNGKFKDKHRFKDPRLQIWWEAAVTGDDQLRQRVAFALSQILVISDKKGLGLYEQQYAIANYYDILIKHAFGNYRDLLEEVTLNPAMGVFLSMIRNQKENIDTGVRPDENYAREFLQLFTIGVNELNLNGTPKLDGHGNTIPTYDQRTIEDFARVFTGWDFENSSWWKSHFSGEDHNKPMVAVEKYHDTSAKTLLNSSISPSGQTAQEDLTFALDNAFEHDNVAPFISKQLIQRLVTSNPNPAYVERVAHVFNDNGNGVKGDLKAVITAILLDEEALAEGKSDRFGKLREPLLRVSHLWRAFNMQRSRLKGLRWPETSCEEEKEYPYYVFWSSLQGVNAQAGQNPLGADSVFNFFRPDFSPNGFLNNQKMVAPEFEIVNENTLTSANNLLYEMLKFFSDTKATTPIVHTQENPNYSKLNLEKEVMLAKNNDLLLDHLSLVLLNNQMSATLRGILKEHLEEESYNRDKNPEYQKVQDAIFLIASSPEYLIQR